MLLIAWVVMPEHVHLLIDPGEIARELGPWLQRLKAGFAHRTLERWREERPEAAARLARPDGSSRFWQPGGGFDGQVEDPWKVRRVARYIHLNPVRRALAARPGDWRWSSAWDGDVNWDPRTPGHEG